MHSQKSGRVPIAVEYVSSPNQPSTSKEETEYQKPSNNVVRRSALNSTAQEITIRPYGEQKAISQH